MKNVTLFFLYTLCPAIIAAQTGQVEGLHENPSRVHAFTNTTLVVAPGRVVEGATLVIREGVIEEAGTGVTPPPDAHIRDMEGRRFYPGFIDLHSAVGMQEPRADLDRGSVARNPQIRSQLSAEAEFEPEEDGSEKLRSQGFTAALSVPPLGIFRGRAAVMSLGSGSVSDRVIRGGVAQSVSLQRSPELGSGYPTSPKGAISLIRQTLYDTEWYERAHATYRSAPQGLRRPETNEALKALVDAANGNQPLLIEAQNEEEVLRSLRFADEFPVTPWIRGSGHEYRIVDNLADAATPLILPLAWPDAPDVEHPEDALGVNLATLRHWYLAPENPARLAAAGIPFSFTTDGLEDPGDFLANLRKAVVAGLDRETALAALTTHPAGLLGIDRTHGTLEQGKTANFIVTDGELFQQGSRILDVWVDGTRFRVNPLPEVDPRGEWQVTSADGSLDGVLEVGGAPGRYDGWLKVDSHQADFSSASLREQARRLRMELAGDSLGLDGPVRLTASVSGDQMNGWAEIYGKGRVEWHAERTAMSEEEEDDEPRAVERELELGELRPAMEFGRPALPERPQHVLVRGATLWTMGPEGILEGADLLVSDGRVAETGRNLRAPPNVVEIDAAGKHITPGLIDAHLHSGTDGVNEVGSAIVPEVRIGDVLNINNIWMYRQLAGGLTTAHLMHGSANPVGGQNQHIKLRWGALSGELKMDGAPRTVKFALGENVKRVGTDRYPETRMGTQQIMADHFRAARDYLARWKEWEQSGEGLPPRRDLRMEALADILEGEILVQAHSYRQDEILMLARLAEEFEIDLKAFHHAVEAYKLAPELAEMGIGAVVWTDWSSFKIEAYDATNYNARLLTEAGVLTSLPSDNSQIAARMNWEAAKMLRAGMDPEEALALVTINTARLLGIDDRVGSLEPGKDADFVIWSGDPLSSFTRAEQTWIDGRKYFDLQEDAEMRKAVEEERAQLIRRILEKD